MLLNISFTAFKTDDYQSRIYATEKSVPYSFGFNSLYGDGMRTALNLKFDLFKILSFWFKVSNTHYFDLDKIGTGLETIYGRNKTDVAMLIKCRF